MSGGLLLTRFELTRRRGKDAFTGAAALCAVRRENAG